MSRLFPRLRRALARAMLIAFLFAIAVLPMPVVPFVVFFLRPKRREVPALVVKRREDDPPP